MPAPKLLVLTYRSLACAAFLVGLYLLYATLKQTVSGSLAVAYFEKAHPSWPARLAALLLRIPVPLHVMSVSLIVQKPWLPPAALRPVWWAVVLSGCWLGLSLGLRFFIL